MNDSSGERLRAAVFSRRLFVRESMGKALAAGGLDPVIQYSEAADLLRGLIVSRPSLAVLHISPGDEMGFAVLENTHQSHPGLPKLVLCDGGNPDTAQRCLELGASGYLEKATASHRSLVEAAHAVAAGERVIQVSAFDLSPAAAAPIPTEPEALRQLSPRERQVLSCLAAGSDNLKIAALLGISERTVKAHVSKLYKKLCQENRAQMAIYAHGLGLKAPFGS